MVVFKFRFLQVKRIERKSVEGHSPGHGSRKEDFACQNLTQNYFFRESTVYERMRNKTY